ncbi:MAG: large conductance mechanosensitive channel protein MscL [Phycisphaerae bacterium]|jgi:large conductance mechanosensitive channel|nr:large conductance mechanosensitive channel protein MscL [Phycisphaerae bacterium]
MGFVSEFREFALKGNVVDMAVGVIIGAAFGKIVNSMVQDIFMPPLGLMIAGVNFKDAKYILQPKIEAVAAIEGKAAVVGQPEVAIAYGNFVNLCIEFVIVALCLFIVIKAMNKVMAAKGSFVPAIPGFGKRE